MMMLIYVLPALLCLNAASAKDLQKTESIVEIDFKRDTEILHKGFDLNSLNKRDLIQLSKVEDEILTGEIDLWSARRGIENKSQTPKRGLWGSVALRLWSAGRNLFRNSRLYKISSPRRGTITKQYRKPGGYRQAVKDYKRLNIHGSRPINGPGGKRGYTGQMGSHKVNVRNKSSGPGSPSTLEIQSKGGKTIRKWRYD